jgi:hypothetical protein
MRAGLLPSRIKIELGKTAIRLDPARSDSLGALDLSASCKKKAIAADLIDQVLERAIAQKCVKDLFWLRIGSEIEPRAALTERIRKAPSGGFENAFEHVEQVEEAELEYFEKNNFYRDFNAKSWLRFKVCTHMPLSISFV